jgi:PAS domain S-box-containing protein
MLGPLEQALADDNGALTPQQREELDIAHRNGLRLMKLVNTLLDFARLEAGRIEASYEPTDLAACTVDLASVFRSAIERTGLRLVVDCPPLPEAIYVDRDMWEKIVLNLLSNAVKFTLAGEIAVSLSWGGAHVALVVRDMGTGIPAHELPHIFTRFYRIRICNARARTHEGTDISLALVQELVRLHGGEITVASEVGDGTIFTVTIPTGTAHLPADRVGRARTLAPTALAADAYVQEALRCLPDRPESPMDVAESFTHASATPLPNAPAHAHILLADDNADMRAYVQRLLSPSWTVEAVSDGVQALAVARERLPDLVLTDIMMPGLDGLALLRALRADPRTAPIPVILLSARAGEEARVEGLAAGADDYLIKPFTARELLARVEAHLTLTRLRREATAREQTLWVEAQATQQKLEDLLAGISDGFVVLDRDWRYTYVNDRATVLMGMGRENLLGRRVWELFPDVVGETPDRELRRALAEQRPASFEYFHPAWQRWFESRVYPAPDGLSVFFNDITERKQVEQVLQQARTALEQRVQERTALLALIQDVTRAANEAPTSTAALQNALDRICAYTGWPVGHVYLAVAPGADRWVPTALWHLDPLERFTTFQQATQASEVVPDDGLLGQVGRRAQPVWSVDLARDLPRPHWHAAVDAGLTTACAVPILVGPEVAGMLALYTAAPQVADHALLAALLQIGTQLGRVIERERAAEQLQHQQTALQQQEKLAAMSTLLASVAHELNNPLATILLQAEIVGEDVQGGPLAEPVAEITQAARCECLVRQFITLAR